MPTTPQQPSVISEEAKEAVRAMLLHLKDSIPDNWEGVWQQKIQLAIDKSTSKLQSQLTKAQEQIKILSSGQGVWQECARKTSDALKHYGKQGLWRSEVIDSHSGECYLFDWPGDLGDNPYDIADKGISLFTQLLKSDKQTPPTQ